MYVLHTYVIMSYIYCMTHAINMGVGLVMNEIITDKINTVLTFHFTARGILPVIVYNKD